MYDSSDGLTDDPELSIRKTPIRTRLITSVAFENSPFENKAFINTDLSLFPSNAISTPKSRKPKGRIQISASKAWITFELFLKVSNAEEFDGVAGCGLRGARGGLHGGRGAAGDGTRGGAREVPGSHGTKGGQNDAV